MEEVKQELIQITISSQIDSALGYMNFSRYIDKFTAKKILQMTLPKLSKIKAGRKRKKSEPLTRQEELEAIAAGEK